MINQKITNNRHNWLIISVFIILVMAMNGCDSVTVWPTIAFTNEPSDVIQEMATLNGRAIIDNTTSIVFEYGPDAGYGNTISSVMTARAGDKYTYASCRLTSLEPGKTYHFRTKLESSEGIIYGNDMTFRTLDTCIVFNPGINYGSVNDIDGNTYRTIQIGTQTWMAENLRTTKYNDGSSITFVKTKGQWLSANSGEYCWMDHEGKFKNIYGAYYNFKAVSSDKLCPTGWHVPEDKEWKILATSLGGEINAGEKLKEKSPNHWINQSSNITNESGFTALPGGYCNYTGVFNAHSYWMGSEAYWWTSSDAYPGGAFYRAIYTNSNALLMGSWRIEMGHNVRCLKDDQPL